MTDTADHAAFEAAALEAANELGEHRSLRADVWRQFKKHKGAVAGMIILVVITFACFVGPILLPFDLDELAIDEANQGPGWPNIWGTDNLGRDAFTRALLGGRISLLVGFVAMGVSIIVGVLVGVLAGFFRRLDFMLMWLTDLFLSLPLLPVLLVVIVLFRDPVEDSLGDALGIFVLMVLIIGGTSWMQTARIVRGEVLSIREQEFILASRSIGTRSHRVIFGHIIPNVLSPVIVAASLGIAIAILTESAVSFLGLGFPLDLPTWGRLLNEAKDRISLNIWLVAGPGLLLSLTVLSVNLIGDGLRDALDPQQRTSA
ncbi:MAG: ABC transporter permease [Acidimicrobiales bacterium]|nr:ABC transporter permease [Acidimicrobiia bacterium]NNC80024.1 ABC transporter permease [Acidimicrobiales bacterium]RZV43779.1 MAG: ABC transporter permease [Acidimicrobiales bacterium]